MMPLPNKSMVLKMFSSPEVPIEHRMMLLYDLCTSDSEEAKGIVRKVVEAASAATAARYDEQLKELRERIRELQEGPLRPAVYLGQEAGGKVVVRFEDGATAIVAIVQETDREQLRLGDAVLLDKGGHAIVARGKDFFNAGQEASWVRSLEGSLIEVELRDEKLLLHMSARLREKFERGEAQPGCSVIVSPRQRIAFDTVPSNEQGSHFVFVDNSPAPDVVIERDIAEPPALLNVLFDYVHLGFTNPALLAKYRLPLTLTALFTGASGVGKSFCVEGLIRQILEMVADILGVPLDELPPRVVRMRNESLLSEYFGRSDKLIARFFQEVLDLYDRPVRGADGREYRLPVIAVGEECDAFSRQRGLDHESVMDRIQTGFLRGLDPARSEYRGRQIVFLFTSNVPELIDAAFLRRAGGFICHFKRLTSRRTFQAVLEKQLHGRLLSSRNGSTQDAVRTQICQDITSWLFSPNSKCQDLVELSCAGSETLVKSRRDFLTAALVERAVRQAAECACRLEADGCEHPGLTTPALARAFADQIDAIVGQLGVRNVANYVDLPEGTRVTNVRRLGGPSFVPMEMVRAS